MQLILGGQYFETNYTELSVTRMHIDASFREEIECDRVGQLVACLVILICIVLVNDFLKELIKLCMDWLFKNNISFIYEMILYVSILAYEILGEFKYRLCSNTDFVRVNIICCVNRCFSLFFTPRDQPPPVHVAVYSVGRDSVPVQNREPAWSPLFLQPTLHSRRRRKRPVFLSAPDPVRSWADAAAHASFPSPHNRRRPTHMKNGDETLASPTATAAAVEEAPRERRLITAHPAKS
jgi:hypothetical protein